MSPANERILEKVKKLLRLTTDRGATESEAKAAAEAAQALLLKHNLKMEEVGDLDADQRQDESIKMDDMTLTGKRNTIGWRKHLLWTICRPLMCRACYSSWRQTMSIVGTPTSTALVKYLYEYLAQTVERLAEAHAEEMRHLKTALMEGWTPSDSANAKHSFAMGCASGIGERLEAKYRQVAQTNDRSRALVVQSEKALEDAFAQFFPRTRKTRVSAGRDWQSRMAGRAASQNIPLHGGGLSGSASGSRKLIG